MTKARRRTHSASHPADSYFEIGLAALIVAACWLFVPALANAFSIKAPLVALAAALLATFYVTRLERLEIPTGAAGMAFALCLLASILSLLFAEQPALAWPHLVALAAFLAITVLALQSGQADRASARFETGLLIGAAGVAVFGLKQFFLPDILDPDFQALGKMKIYSTIGNPNLVALVLLPALPLCAWRLRSGAPSTRLGWGALLVLLLACLIATQSRQALLAVAFMLVLTATWLGSMRVRRAALVVTALCLVAVVAWTLSADAAAGTLHTAKGRLFIWLTSLQMLWDHPVTGVGPGHFGLHQLAYQSQFFESGRFDAFLDNAAMIEDAHNDYLHFGATTGVLGLIGFTLLCAATLWHGWRSRTLKRRAPQYYIAFAGLTFAMLFTAGQPHAATALVFWMLLALVMLHAELPRRSWRLAIGGRVVASAALMALLLSASWWTWRDAHAGYAEAQADRLMEEHDAWLAGRQYQRALEWNPHNGVVLKKSASIEFIQGNATDALATLQRARLYSGDVGIRILEAEILTRLGRLDDAEAAYRELIFAFPKMIGPHFILGQIYRARGKAMLAETEFRTVLAIEPSPFNINMTRDKLRLQKRLASKFLGELTGVPSAASDDDSSLEDASAE